MLDLSDNVPTFHSVPKGHLKVGTVSEAPQHFQPCVQRLTSAHTGQWEGEQRRGEQEEGGRHPFSPSFASLNGLLRGG